MKIYEFGKENPETILFLHGGGLSWWNYKEEAELLKERYHIVIPVLDGHGESEDPFVSIEENAQRILNYIDQLLGGRILALCALSLGAQIAVEMLAQRKDVCTYALIESVSLIPSRLTHLLVGPSFSSSYFLIEKEWFSKLQFKALHIKEDLYEDYYRDTCKIKKENMISFMKANTSYSLPSSISECQAKVYVVIGGKESSNMKRSAKLLVSSLSNASLRIMDGLYHGELSLNHPEKYVELFMELMK